MDYIVRSISDKKGMEDFLHLPYIIYKDDHHWIAPLSTEIQRVLDPRINPFFREASLRIFVCYREERPVARAIAVVNPEYWARWKRFSAFFGFFESLNDQHATDALFLEIEAYCKGQGAQELEGPFNPNHYSEMGLLTGNFQDEPLFFETYNPSWYGDLLVHAGFLPVKKIHTRINSRARAYFSETDRSMQLKAIPEEYKIRNFNLFRFRSDLEKMREINNDAFSDNPWFLPLSKEEYLFSSKWMFLITSTGLIKFVEFKNQPVGVVQCVLNINPVLKTQKGRITAGGLLRLFLYRKKRAELIIYATGVKKEFRNTVTAAIMFNSICNMAKKYKVLASTWMSEDNRNAVRSAEKLGTVPYKWFTMYNKKLV